jgi:hypothetical protein
VRAAGGRDGKNVRTRKKDVIGRDSYEPSSIGQPEDAGPYARESKKARPAVSTFKLSSSPNHSQPPDRPYPQQCLSLSPFPLLGRYESVFSITTRPIALLNSPISVRLNRTGSRQVLQRSPRQGLPLPWYIPGGQDRHPLQRHLQGPGYPRLKIVSHPRRHRGKVLGQAPRPHSLPGLDHLQRPPHFRRAREPDR